MNERDPVGATLEALVPPFDHIPAEWDDVLRRANRPVAPPPPRRFPRSRALALAAVAVLAAISLVALVDPFAEDDAGVLDQALAAVGDGPVLHVVTRSGRGGTLVDLDSGSRSEIRIEQDAWFDPARGFRSTIRFGGTVLEEYSVRLGEPIRLRAAGRAMQTFTRDYRNALRDGRARIVREGTVAGTPVYWLRVELPRPAPRGSPCGRRACQDVAISRETYLPVFVHYGSARHGFGERILELESLPAGTGDIPGKAGPSIVPGFEPLPRRRTNRPHARRLLGAPLVWPGRRVSGLPLARIEAGGERVFRFNGQMRRPRFEPPTHVISLVFGGAGRGLVVNQARRPTWSLQRGPAGTGTDAFGAPAGYAPPEGSALLTDGGRRAVLRRRGLVIGIVGSSPDLVRGALRALSRAR